MTAIEGLSSDGGSGVHTAGASAQLVGPNDVREALRVQVDPAATGPVYLLLGTGTCSATNFHIALNKDDVWEGTIGRDPNNIWAGAVQFFSATATDKVGVVEI